MSKLIRQLLDESDPRFAHSLARLEYSAGNPGIDVRLTAEIMSMVAAKHRELGLDPSDTTGHELYAALRNKVLESDEYLRAYLGHPASTDEASMRIAELARTVLGKKSVWAVRAVVLKKIIKANAPKKVMKAFHFTSVDSLIKRMDPGEIMLAARVVESKTWWEKTKKTYAGLSTKDFEQAELRVIAPVDERWLKVFEAWHQSKTERVVASKEAGVLAVNVGLGKGQALACLLSVLRQANELMAHGAYLKLHFVHPSIGNVLVHAVDDGELMRTSVSGAVFHWRDVQRYFGTLAAEGDMSFVHLDTHDLGWLRLEMALSLRIPELAFWVGTDVVGVSYGDERTISMNAIDVAHSVARELDYRHMELSHLKRALRSELMARYVQFPASRALVLKQFDISDNISEDW